MLDPLISPMCETCILLVCPEMYPGWVLASSEVQIMILATQNSSKYISLDAQIVIFDFGSTKSKQGCPSGF